MIDLDIFFACVIVFNFHLLRLTSPPLFKAECVTIRRVIYFYKYVMSFDIILKYFKFGTLNLLRILQNRYKCYLHQNTLVFDTRYRKN